MTLIPLAASAAFACFVASAIIELRSAPVSGPGDVLALTRCRLEHGEIDRYDYERIARVLTS